MEFFSPKTMSFRTSRAWRHRPLSSRMGRNRQTQRDFTWGYVSWQRPFSVLFSSPYITTSSHFWSIPYLIGYANEWLRNSYSPEHDWPVVELRPRMKRYSYDRVGNTVTVHICLWLEWYRYESYALRLSNGNDLFPHLLRLIANQPLLKYQYQVSSAHFLDYKIL